MQQIFTDLIIKFKEFLRLQKIHPDLIKKRITFGSLRKSGMCILTADRFSSEDICFFSRHAVSNSKFSIGNKTLLTSYVDKAKANSLLKDYKASFEALTWPSNSKDFSDPPVEF